MKRCAPSASARASSLRSVEVLPAPWAGALAAGWLVAGALGCATTSASQKLPCTGAADVGRCAWRLVDERAKRDVEPRPDEHAQAWALVGGTVMTAAGDVYERGYVLERDGRIVGVGPGDPPSVDGYHVIDATGMWVTPGLIDAHSHLGDYPWPAARAHADGNEVTDPNTAGVWAESAVWPQDPAFERALAGGVTTLQVLPGSANLIGGRGVTLHMVPARGSRAMRFPGAPDGLKMACGENPKRTYGSKGRSPQTRMGNVRGMREALARAREKLRELAKWKADAADDLPERDIDLESLEGALLGELLPQVHCYRADDMLHVIELADEFGLHIRAFHHATEAYKIRDVLAAHHIGAAVWADWWGFKLEAYDAVPAGAAMLAQAGVRVAIHSDSPRGITRLNQEAAKALAAGRRVGIELSENEALRWITANPAWILGIDREVGTLEQGKRADVVVWDRHPFSVYAHARCVFVDGVLRYDRARQGTPWSDFEVGLHPGAPPRAAAPHAARPAPAERPQDLRARREVAR